MPYRQSSQEEDSSTTDATTRTRYAKPPNRVEEEDDEDDEEMASTSSTSTAATTTTTTTGVEFRDPLVPAWTHCTQTLQKAVIAMITKCALQAVKYPKTTVGVITLVSVVLITVGVLHVQIELDVDHIFTPIDSRSWKHQEWITRSSSSSSSFHTSVPASASAEEPQHLFPPPHTRLVQLIFHNHGQNVVHQSQARRVLEAFDLIRTTPGFSELCPPSSGVLQEEDNGEQQHQQQQAVVCRIWSMSAFWVNHSLKEFDATIHNDDDLAAMLASNNFADGSPVVLPGSILGKYEYATHIVPNAVNTNTTNAYWELSNTINNTANQDISLQQQRRLTSAQSYLIQMELPNTIPSVANQVEAVMLQRLDDMRQQWQHLDQHKDNDDDDTASSLTMDITSLYAHQLEYYQAIVGDLYLVVITMILLVAACTCLTFYCQSPNQLPKSSWLGLASVMTIACSIMTSYGCMFLVGIPYSVAHQILPFMIMGIGLDNNFIIAGAFFRTPTASSMEDRIQTTMQEVGWSISVTTLTTVVAFFLGYMSSSLLGVHWLCLYAITTLSIAFLYQITYFAALLELGERLKDCCCWIPIHNHHHDTSEEEEYNTDDTSCQTGNGNGNGNENGNTYGGSYLVSTPCRNESLEVVWSVDTTKSQIFDYYPGQSTCTSYDNEDNNNNDSGSSSYPTNPQKQSMSITSYHSERLDSTKSQTFDHYPSQRSSSSTVENSNTTNPNKSPAPGNNHSFRENLMSWYADILLQPCIKVMVLVLFAIFFGICCRNLTCLTQEFDVNSFVNDDSYLKNAFSSLNDYSNVVRPIAVYFRNVDQLSPDVQQQMIDYIKELESLPQMGALNDTHFRNGDNATAMITTMKDGSSSSLFLDKDKVLPRCWVRDFLELDQYFTQQSAEGVFGNMTFAQKINLASSYKTARELYGDDIVQDDDGNILVSRCYVFLQDLDFKDVAAQIQMLHDQREVTEAQPINQLEETENQWSFFAFDEMFLYWEAYAVSMDELIFTMISGVVAMTAIAVVCIPHWTASLLVCPLIIILYINMLGSLACLGLHINGITFICIVASIGLMIDVLVHVLLRYYEGSPGKTRNERVKETLATMGASILMGGATTLLAVIPLAASSVKIFITVFWAFFAMVSLGIIHGLILLPVILSLVGPTTNVKNCKLPAPTIGSDHSNKENGSFLTPMSLVGPTDNAKNCKPPSPTLSIDKCNEEDVRSDKPVPKHSSRPSSPSGFLAMAAISTSYDDSHENTGNTTVPVRNPRSSITETESYRTSNNGSFDDIMGKGNDNITLHSLPVQNLLDTVSEMESCSSNIDKSTGGMKGNENISHKKGDNYVSRRSLPVRNLLDEVSEIESYRSTTNESFDDTMGNDNISHTKANDYDEVSETESFDNIMGNHNISHTKANDYVSLYSLPVQNLLDEVSEIESSRSSTNKSFDDIMGNNNISHNKANDYVSLHSLPVKCLLDEVSEIESCRTPTEKSFDDIMGNDSISQIKGADNISMPPLLGQTLVHNEAAMESCSITTEKSFDDMGNDSISRIKGTDNISLPSLPGQSLVHKEAEMESCSSKIDKSFDDIKQNYDISRIKGDGDTSELSLPFQNLTGKLSRIKSYNTTIDKSFDDIINGSGDISHIEGKVGISLLPLQDETLIDKETEVASYNSTTTKSLDFSKGIDDISALSLSFQNYTGELSEIDSCNTSTNKSIDDMNERGNISHIEGNVGISLLPLEHQNHTEDHIDELSEIESYTTSTTYDIELKLISKVRIS